MDMMLRQTQPASAIPSFLWLQNGELSLLFSMICRNQQTLEVTDGYTNQY